MYTYMSGSVCYAFSNDRALSSVPQRGSLDLQDASISFSAWDSSFSNLSVSIASIELFGHWAWSEKGGVANGDLAGQNVE